MQKIKKNIKQLFKFTKRLNLYVSICTPKKDVIEKELSKITEVVNILNTKKVIILNTYN